MAIPEGLSKTVEVGVLLVANPRMMDPNFMHAVVLICDHGPDGSYGLIVNRPTSMTLTDFGSDDTLLAGRKDRVYQGGPVSQTTLQVVHNLPSPIPGAVTMAPGIHLGGDAVVLRKALDGFTPPDRHVRFLLGYAGWSADQLTQELTEGAWLMFPAREEHIFGPHPERLWRDILREHGGTLARMADLPPDPSWN